MGRRVRILAFGFLLAAPPTGAAEGLEAGAGPQATDSDRLGREAGIGREREWSDEPVSDWRDLVLTAKALGSRLAHPTNRDLVAYAVLATGAAQLQNRKFDIAGEFREDRSGRSNRLSSAIRPLGESLVPVAALSTYLIGRMAGSRNARSAGLILGESAIFTFAVTEVGQYVFAERRPYQGGGMRFFSPGGHGISGHTSILASAVAPLDRMYMRFSSTDSRWGRGFKIVGKGLLYGAPALVGWSRMNDDLHFAWNVFLGYGTGYMIGGFVADAHGLGSRDGPARDWSVIPITGDRGTPGLAFRWQR